MKNTNKESTLFILIIFLFASFSNTTRTADAIIFSYDRPLQLYSLLESIEYFITNNQEIHLIIKASSAPFKKAYDEVFMRFKDMKLNIHYQKTTRDFKPIVLNTLRQIKSKYVYFAVDDIIVKDYIDLKECTEALEKHEAYGFYLRLGKNCTHSPSPILMRTPLPTFTINDNSITGWNIYSSKGYWGYPNTVDMTIYRTNNVLCTLQNLPFRNPNTMEALWASKPPQQNNSTGLCYQKSAIVNIPLNKVQTVCQTFNVGISTTYLLEAFNEGLKFDLNKVYRTSNKSPHEVIDLTLIPREGSSALAYEKANNINIPGLLEAKELYSGE